MSKSDMTLQDRKVLTLAANGKSAEEIAEQTGIPAEKVILRVKELIGSRNVWDAMERENLLLHSIYELKEKLEDNIEAILGDPKLLESYRKTLELLGQRLESRSQLNEEDLLRISDAHARKMVTIINLGYYRARQALAEQYPEVDLLVIDGAFNEGMDQAALEIEAAQEQ